MLKTENQFNTKASIFPIEEWYTQDYVNNHNFEASTGYSFDYPLRWLTDLSQNKAIGIRRLQITPTSHSFNLNVSIKRPSGAVSGMTNKFDITSANTLLEILNLMTRLFKSGATNNKWHLEYNYDCTKGNLTLFVINDEVTENDPNRYLPFRIFKTGSMSDPTESFLKFLNQPLEDEIIQLTNNYNVLKEYSNVWDRDKLYFHSSFSQSHRQIIGTNGDFYINPSLLYPSPTNTSEFYIRFTTDHVKPLILLYSTFDIQLCFILNYKNTIIDF